MPLNFCIVWPAVRASGACSDSGFACARYASDTATTKHGHGVGISPTCSHTTPRTSSVRYEIRVYQRDQARCKTRRKRDSACAASAGQERCTDRTCTLASNQQLGIAALSHPPEFAGVHLSHRRRRRARVKGGQQHMGFSYRNEAHVAFSIMEAGGVYQRLGHEFLP